MSDFKHKPINLEGPAFCLLRLLKGDDGPIQGELIESRLPPLEYDRDYAAISYTWGSERRPCEIWINGSKLRVTKNAYLALRDLRYKEKDRVLWIDTLCINQNDDVERGKQVQQMGSIYSQAERVIIWLGEATYDTDYVMHYMKLLEIESTKHTSNDRDLSHEQWMNLCYYFVEIGLRESGLYKKLLARVAEIACGCKSVITSIFTRTLSLLDITPDPHCQPIFEIMPGPLRNSSWWAEKRDLRTMLGKFCKSEATDPRDSIYALLGISSDADNTDLLKANYEKDLQDVIFDTALFLLGLGALNPPRRRIFDWTLPEFMRSLNSLANEVLTCAISAEHEALVKLLIVRNDVDVNIVLSGQTPLTWAAGKGHEEVVELLLGKGADLETRDGTYGRTPLIWAAKNGHKEVAELLLEKGAKLEPLDNNRQTAVSFAAQNGHKAVVELLLERGSRLENGLSNTPLLWAARNGHREVVQLLLEKGASLEPRYPSDRTPLSYAAQNGYKVVVELLLEKGAKLDTRDTERRTPLLYAAQNGHEAVVRMLIEKGAELEVKDSHGCTPLSRAAALGSKAVTELLLEKGADPKTKDNFKRTPLFWAVSRGQEAVVRMLIEKGAKLEAKNIYGQTPLFLAAAKGREAVVELLLEKGAKLAVRDKDGRTPLSIARMCGHKDVVELLLEKGA